MCPSCGEEDVRKLAVYSAEEFRSVRVEACDTCHAYLKTIDVSAPVFNSPRVDCWLLTTVWGGKNVSERLKTIGRERSVRIIGVGQGQWIDLPAAVEMLRKEHGIKTLLCEGGPTVYAGLLRNRLIDEDFRTLSLQVLGRSTVGEIERPTSYADVSYTPDTAPWFSLISLHYSLPHHVFLRLRYVGARPQSGATGQDGSKRQS